MIDVVVLDAIVELDKLEMIVLILDGVVLVVDSVACVVVDSEVGVLDMLLDSVVMLVVLSFVVVPDVVVVLNSVVLIEAVLDSVVLVEVVVLDVVVLDVVVLLDSVLPRVVDDTGGGREGMVDGTGDDREAGGGRGGIADETSGRCGRLGPTGIPRPAAMPAKISKKSRSCCAASVFVPQGSSQIKKISPISISVMFT